MAEVKLTPLWFRILEIIFGIIGIIITLYFAMVFPLWIILNHYLTYIGGWMLLFGTPVILFGILLLIRAFVYKDEKKWLRGSTVLLGIVMILRVVIGIYLDF